MGPKSRIYTICWVKVMIDADLAEIYGYSTKAFNQQVKNNIEKFDENFRFQLSDCEINLLSRSNFLTSMQTKGERAVAQSKALIRLFNQMKDYFELSKVGNGCM